MKKLKIHPVFRKRYGENAFAKKIRARLFIDADRSWSSRSSAPRPIQKRESFACSNPKR
jgi:hypothetical protein